MVNNNPENDPRTADTAPEPLNPPEAFEERACAYRLACLPFLSGREIFTLLRAFGSPQEILRASDREISSVLPPGAAGEIRKFRERHRGIDPQEEYEQFLRGNIRLCIFGDADYPARLSQISDPPFALFRRGRLPNPDVPAVAVIGARECSDYGRHIAEELGAALGKAGVPVISGMARGIDGICQRAALDAGGTSYGILGCGVDVIYPRANRELYERLIEGGGVLSSYPPGTRPLAIHFPPRNRIVSGLADALIVVEARQKSGTLITVDMALDQGRDVYAVPGRITDRLSDGCNTLLGQGAQVFLSPELFLRELAMDPRRLLVRENASEADKPPRTGLSGSGEESRPGAPSAPGFPAPADPAFERAFRSFREKRARMRRAFGGSDPPEPDASPDALAVWRLLSFVPQSAEDLLPHLPAEFTAGTVSLLLMQLVLAGCARQVSPGQFVKI